jgi:hypothetical protein
MPQQSFCLSSPGTATSAPSMRGWSDVTDADASCASMKANQRVSDA